MYGQRWTRHQWFSVLHHGCQVPLAGWDTHMLRKGLERHGMFHYMRVGVAVKMNHDKNGRCILYHCAETNFCLGI